MPPQRLMAFAVLAFVLSTAPVVRAAKVSAVLDAEIVTLGLHIGSAYIMPTFGDTLFAPDSNGELKPQMVDDWSVSDDRLTWRFSLSDAVRFHDGAPVTAADVVASLKRRGKRNAPGGRLLAVMAVLEAADAAMVVLRFREPCGLVIETLGATGATAPFLMPARPSKTPGTKQLTETVCSGAFVYDPVQHRTGDRMSKGNDKLDLAKPPFDDPAIRRALLDAVGQEEDILQSLGLDENFERSCDEFFICHSPYATANPDAPRGYSVEAATID